VTFEALTAQTAAVIDAALDDLLPRGGRLADAMRYAALAPGKRLRPFFLIETAGLMGVSGDSVIRAACALELIHAYSLIHDDLPCMDDDDLRRGRPTTHKAFDEATAVLAGDALQTLAFEVLASAATHPHGSVRAGLVLILARAAGQAGMAGGQMLDLSGDADIERMQALKTGALILAAFEMALALSDPDPLAQDLLTGFGRDLGLAYQIADDLLDAEGDSQALGKAAGGKDAAKGKANLVTVMGIQAARDRLAELRQSALRRIEIFGDKATSLRDALDFVLERRS
jgi:farnesyl diphosphate synthase